jgi:hypothetical protein
VGGWGGEGGGCQRAGRNVVLCGVAGCGYLGGWVVRLARAGGLGAGQQNCHCCMPASAFQLGETTRDRKHSATENILTQA